jgi:hypothetical protein
VEISVSYTCHSRATVNAAEVTLIAALKAGERWPLLPEVLIAVLTGTAHMHMIQSHSGVILQPHVLQ